MRGIDNIQDEVLKEDVGITVDTLWYVFTTIWNEEVIQGDWQKGVIAKLVMKSNLEVCDNWRGVTLLSGPGNVLCRIIIDRKLIAC